MFAKLLKHELKSCSGLLSILSVSALGVGLLGGFLLRFAVNRSGMGNEMEILAILAIVALPFIFVSLLAYALGGEIYLTIQFYKSKFTDRGYLTFTLPVRGWQIYLSSLINMVLWTTIITLVVLASMAITFIFGFYNTFIWHEMAETVMYIPYEDLELAFGFSFWAIVQSVVGFISSNVILITGITLGCVVAKKHKVLASIGFYFAISTVLSMVNAVISISTMFATVGGNLDFAYIVGTLIEVAVITGGSVVSVWLMNKKLNLP